MKGTYQYVLLEVMFRSWYFAPRVVHSCGNKHICFITFIFPPILCSVQYGGSGDVNRTQIALTPWWILGAHLNYNTLFKIIINQHVFYLFFLSVLLFKFHPIKYYLHGKTIQGLIILRLKVNPCHIVVCIQRG